MRTGYMRSSPSKGRHRDVSPGMPPGDLHRLANFRSVQLRDEKRISENVDIERAPGWNTFSIGCQGFSENNSPRHRGPSVAELTQRLEAVHLSEMLHHGQRSLLLGFTVVRLVLSEVSDEVRHHVLLGNKISDQRVVRPVVVLRRKRLHLRALQRSAQYVLHTAFGKTRQGDRHNAVFCYRWNPRFGIGAQAKGNAN